MKIKPCFSLFSSSNSSYTLAGVFREGVKDWQSFLLSDRRDTASTKISSEPRTLYLFFMSRYRKIVTELLRNYLINNTEKAARWTFHFSYYSTRTKTGEIFKMGRPAIFHLLRLIFWKQTFFQLKEEMVADLVVIDVSNLDNCYNSSY